ncbi:WD40 repeat-like protein [Neoconidiobolus thromboides FSU 785]|nr:WD40 repeat-like protein [Neoconidiobolus thromboides FSU 785]
MQRNYDPILHPFEKSREYTRALNATKLERMFAKPFIASLDGHADGVYCLSKHYKNLQTIVSGSGDGEVRAWRLNERSCFFNTTAHNGIVKGVCILPEDNKFISVGHDKVAKIWDVNSEDSSTPLYTYQGKSAFTGVDHHISEPKFATSGSIINIWDINRSEPISTFEWGADTINTVKFNKTERNIVASCGTDRAITLYDIRSNSPLSKTYLQLKSNALCWNPMEAYNFVVGNEDHNLYLFDMRKMNKAVSCFRDHVSAVMDVDFDPTGRQIVSGSYDRTVRIFTVGKPKSRDVYHTKRMQRVFTVKYSMDGRFVLSGSDDTNIRLWKSNAAEKLGVRNNRERSHLEYSEKVKDKYAHIPEVRKIANHRIIPQNIKTTTRTKAIMLESRHIKEVNRLNNQKNIRNATQAKEDKNKDKKPKTIKEKVVLYSEK